MNEIEVDMRLLTVMLLCAVSAPAIERTTVFFVSASVNEHGVRIVNVVHAREKAHGTMYSVSCNEDDKTCGTPDGAVSYTLADGAEVYKCENVVLIPSDSNRPTFHYCLKGVTPY